MFSKINWWCVTFIKKDSEDITTIINDRNQLINYYLLHEDDIFVGYNSRMYDQYIFKGILDGMNPSYVNDQLISYNKKGYQIVKNAKKYHLNNYDCILKDKSLKQLEGFMGSEIKESDVPFDIDRPLTKKEIDEVVKYNIHDVLETLKVLKYTMEDFEAQLDMIEMFNLNIEMFNKTKAQLASHILGAVPQHTLDDEFEFTVPKNLDMPSKYQHIIDWYMNPINKSYKLPLKDNSKSNATRQLFTTVAGVPCVYGYGGLHGSIDNEIFEGIIIIADVASLYPSLMINEWYISRKLKNPKDFKNMKRRRLELKKAKDKRQKPLKIVINGAYGILKDRNSPCFDPLQSNQVCLSGQWYLTELAAKLEGKCKVLQINTDGIYVLVESMTEVSPVIDIMHSFENRSKLELEIEVFEHGKLIQKDVNNYILIDEDDKKHYKSKGAYVKKLSPIDNDLPIINKALIDYFVYDIPVETTINNSNNLIDFQKIIKLTSKYKGVVYGDAKTIKVGKKDRNVVENGTPLKEKVHRVFASTRKDDRGIHKVKMEKGEESYEKVPYTPTKCFIDNNNIIGKEVPDYLDRQYYIDVAHDRIKQFLEKKPIKVDNTSDVLFECMCESEDYISFLAKVRERGITKKVLEGYLKANCCESYGKTKKLLIVKDLFDILYGKEKFTVKNINKKIKDENVLNIIINNSELTKTGKSYTGFDYKKALKEIFEIIPDNHIDIFSIMSEQVKKFEEVRYVDENEPINRWFVLNVRDIIAPNIIIYNLHSGKVKYQKVKKDIYKILPVQNGDIIDITHTEMQYGSKIIDKDENGINVVAADVDKQHEVISGYSLVFRNYTNETKLVSKGDDVA